MTWPLNVTFTLVDFETTGLHPQGNDRVVEFAYVTIRNGQRLGSGESLVNPNGQPISQGAFAIHGISEQMVVNQPTFENAAGSLWNAINGNVFVAHNANFDLKCFVHECRRVGWKVPDFVAIDSLKIARKVWSRPNYKLETLANAVGHGSENAHRAMADVEMMVSVMNSIFEKFPNRFPNLQSLDAFRSKIPIATPTPNHNFSQMGRSIQSKIGRKVSIDYHSNKSGRSIRDITPIEIFYNGHNEMLKAMCHRDGTQKSFRIDRIYELY
tara:strand:+ start:2306 stop:3112 length:807 start_codon:yes stop_codon:yes gene_type:complete